MTEENKLILKKLDEIKTELNYIKDRIVDEDSIMTEDDYDSIREAEQDLQKGMTERIA